MCQGIMELSNALIYGDRLRCGSPEIAHAGQTHLFKFEISFMVDKGGKSILQHNYSF